MKEDSILVFLLWAILLAGCSENTMSRAGNVSRQQPTTNPYKWTLFVYGNARIEIGQSKERIAGEVKKSVHEWNNLTIKISDPPDVDANEWVLGYGAGGGRAPGSGTLKLVFKDNLLVSLFHYPDK